MKILTNSVVFLFAACCVSGAEKPQTNAPSGNSVSLPVELRAEWIDADTGHRVIRLSREPGSASLYFHQNAYTAKGDKIIISTPGGLSAVNLKTREIELVAPGVRYSMGSSSGIEVGRKSREVFYTKRNETNQSVIYATHLDTKATREIARLTFGGTFGGLTADEKLLFGSYSESNRDGVGRPQIQSQSSSNEQGQATSTERRPGRRSGPRAMKFFSVNTETGEIKTFYPSTNFLNHTQCSPTDPSLALFCHEGEWHNVDRIWTIHTDGTGARLMHARTMPYEIAGHEFFSHDGTMIWYDLQTPRSAVFWLAGVNVETGARIRYPIERSHWSVHYNVSWDGKLFSGDGGGPASVANRTPLPDNQPLDPPANGQWIYLFRPAQGKFETMKVGEDTVQIGKFDVEKLVNLSNHNYSLEPNATFTPDDKWIVFRSNLQGLMHVYAVEIAKSDKQ